MATTFALFAIMILAKPILIPLSVALLISFILLPLARKYETWKISRIFAAFLSIFSVILIIAGVIYFFSAQLLNMSKEFTDFKDKIISAFADVTVYINNNLSFVENLKRDELLNRMKEWLSDSTGFLIKKTVNNAATFIAGLMATIVFLFLFLIYRDGLTQAFLDFSPKDKRNRVFKMFKSVQQVGQKYLFGMLLLTIIIGLANSLGLLIIGIDNPFLFGFLGAVLAIIPYIGAVMGALIPVIYAFVSYDSIWMPVAVVILFYFVQLVTDNFLAPKIVGSSLKLNALTVILSLFIGAAVWGIAGMILFLPFAAMIRVVCEEFDALKPVALIMGEHNKKESDGNGPITVWWEKIKKRVSN
ncbi:MAG: AI-2E family transporter [Bacteroidota bacterium]|nr:AI-2E family transporter [Bacteroidota bacterium]